MIVNVYSEYSHETRNCMIKSMPSKSFSVSSGTGRDLRPRLFQCRGSIRNGYGKASHDVSDTMHHHAMVMVGIVRSSIRMYPNLSLNGNPYNGCINHCTSPIWSIIHLSNTAHLTLRILSNSFPPNLSRVDANYTLKCHGFNCSTVSARWCLLSI